MELAVHLQNLEQNTSSFYIWNSRQENFDAHTHEQAQLTYIEQGVTVLYVNNQSYFIPANHYVWIPAGVKHQFVHRNTALNIRSVFIEADKCVGDAFYTTLGIYPITNLLLEMLLYTDKWTGGIEKNTIAYQFCDTLLAILPDTSQHNLPFALPTTEDKRLGPILKHIHHFVDDDLTLQSVGQLFGYTERTLSRLFVNQINMTFFQYLKLTRMIKAMEMLIQTDLSVGEIAYSVGYTSVSSFSNVFKEITRVRPTDFMKQNRAK